MRSLVTLTILIYIIPVFPSYVIIEPEKTTWSLYEITPSEPEQVTLLRTMIAGYPMEVAINGEIREDETAFFLMKTKVNQKAVTDLTNAEILYNKKQALRIPSRNKENVFGVYGGDVSAEDSE